LEQGKLSLASVNGKAKSPNMALEISMNGNLLKVIKVPPHTHEEVKTKFSFLGFCTQA
jgi:hypothetical protein